MYFSLHSGDCVHIFWEEPGVMKVSYQFTSQLSGRGHGGNVLFMLRGVSLSMTCMRRSPSTCTTSKWTSCILLRNEGSRCSCLSCMRSVDAHLGKRRSLWWGRNLSPPRWRVDGLAGPPITDHLSCWLISLIVLIESHPSPAVDCATAAKRRNGDRAAELAHFIKSEPSAYLSHGQSSRSWFPSMNNPHPPSSSSPPHFCCLWSADEWQPGHTCFPGTHGHNLPITSLRSHLNA